LIAYWYFHRQEGSELKNPLKNSSLGRPYPTISSKLSAPLSTAHRLIINISFKMWSVLPETQKSGTSANISRSSMCENCDFFPTSVLMRLTWQKRMKNLEF
jgi:hypothetical protein